MCGRGFIGGLIGWLVTGAGDGKFDEMVVVMRVDVVNLEGWGFVTTTIGGMLRSKR